MIASFGLHRPSIYVPNLNHINFRYLRDHLKIAYLIFDKDDTFCIEHADRLHPRLSPSKVEEILNTFGNRTFFCSNDKKNWKFDWENLNHRVNTIGAFRKIEVQGRKPWNSEDVWKKLAEFVGEEPDPAALCFIGDRVLTDICIAKRFGCMSVLLDCFPESSHRPTVRMLKFIEDKMIRDHLGPFYLDGSSWNSIPIDPVHLFHK